MKSTYRFLQKSIWVLLVELVFVALLGAVSFGYLFNSATYTLPFPHAIIILFIFAVLCAIGTAIYVCVKAENVGISHIKKTNKFILFADAFAVIMMLAFFIYECITSMTYVDSQNKALVFFRVARWVLSIPALGYFVIQAFPSKIRRVKITIPTYLKIITSICLILWCVFGIFTTYFKEKYTTPNDVTKITMMFIYAIIALFFIFEGEFQFVATRHKPYMMFSFFTSIVTFAIPLGISVAKIFRADMSYAARSQPELLMCFAIGIYALAKMFALISTMRLVIENSHGHHHSSDKNSKRENTNTPADQNQ